MNGQTSKRPQNRKLFSEKNQSSLLSLSVKCFLLFEVSLWLSLKVWFVYPDHEWWRPEARARLKTDVGML